MKYAVLRSNVFFHLFIITFTAGGVQQFDHTVSLGQMFLLKAYMEHFRFPR